MKKSSTSANWKLKENKNLMLINTHNSFVILLTYFMKLLFKLNIKKFKYFKVKLNFNKHYLTKLRFILNSL